MRFASAVTRPAHESTIPEYGSGVSHRPHGLQTIRRLVRGTLVAVHFLHGDRPARVVRLPEFRDAVIAPATGNDTASPSLYVADLTRAVAR